MIRCVVFDLYGVLYPDEDGHGRQVVESVKAPGYQVAAITNLPQEVALKAAEGVGIEDVVVSGEVGLSKTSPAIYREFVEYQGVKPDECVMIDDTVENLRAAKQAGWWTVFLGEGEAMAADFQIRELGDILGVLDKL